MIGILIRRCCLWVVVCLAGHASVAVAQVVLRPELRPISQITSTAHVEVHGIVNDERGQPLGGAVVSALGATTAFAISDPDGRFIFRSLPPGPYLVRAHLRGYLLARGRLLQVTATAPNLPSITLTKRSEAGDPSPVVTAGLGVSEAPDALSPTEEADGHEHGEVAWRLRHLKRSVLKDVDTSLSAIEGDSSLLEDSLAGLTHAVGGPARFASALFSDLALNGQINLLTTTSFDRPQDLFSSGSALPRGVAYLSLAAPGANGEWRMRGTVTQGDLSSWIVAGSYIRNAQAAHQYEAGFSYAMQRYLGGNVEALAAMRGGSRNVGAVYAYDDWAITPRLHVNYGAKYASYDYLGEDSLRSPRASVTVQPFSRDSLKLRALLSHRESAPGAEEFIPPSTGLWLPPERTFSAVSRDGFRPERLDHVELAAERELPGEIQIGFRAFRQRTEDQVVTLFGASVVDAMPSTGHYLVGSAGDFEAAGWSVSVSRGVADGVRMSVDYAQIATDWNRRSSDEIALSRLAGSVLRAEDRIHDLTASIESVVAPTSTRVYVLYKVNTSFAPSNSDLTMPVGGARFDVQINQALPFLKFTNAHWEALVAVRNLFHDDLIDASVYDELLVVRPPKRVLGGVTVRF